MIFTKEEFLPECTTNEELDDYYTSYDDTKGEKRRLPGHFGTIQGSIIEGKVDFVATFVVKSTICTGSQ